MKTFSDTFSKNYADWSAVGTAMVLGHAPASPDKNPNAKPALPPAKKRPAKKAKRAKRR